MSDNPSITQRPWGFFEVLAEAGDFKIKRIVVAPGHSLSLQRHRFRREHWFFLSGEAEVTIDGTVSRLRAGGSADIPPGTLHRLTNPGRQEVSLIEIQTGESFSEDDIERLFDDYGRN